jgi:hypothetical protein
LADKAASMAVPRAFMEFVKHELNDALVQVIPAVFSPGFMSQA